MRTPGRATITVTRGAVRVVSEPRFMFWLGVSYVVIAVLAWIAGRDAMAEWTPNPAKGPTRD